MIRTLPVAAAAVLAVAAIAGCGGSTATRPAAVASALQVQLVNSQLWPGPDDVLFDVLDDHWSSVELPAADVAVTLRDPDGASAGSLVAEAIELSGTGRPLYRVRADLDRAGAWRLEVRAKLDDRTVDAAAELVVEPDAPGTPRIGDRVPGTANPVGIAALEAALLASPAPELADISVADALAQGRPFVFVVDTLLVPSTESCGTGLAHVAHLAAEFPDVPMIQAEPYRTRVVDGRLVLDPADGALVVTPWAAAWGAGSPPWVFIVDGNGRLRAKLSGVMGTDELRAALAAVAA